jgi:hypothetical protein
MGPAVTAPVTGVTPFAGATTSTAFLAVAACVVVGVVGGVAVAVTTMPGGGAAWSALTGSGLFDLRCGTVCGLFLLLWFLRLLRVCVRVRVRLGMLVRTGRK